MRGLNLKWVIVIRDAEEFDLLQVPCIEYEESVSFPCQKAGIYNYQKSMLKPYAEAGLII